MWDTYTFLVPSSLSLEVTKYIVKMSSINFSLPQTINFPLPQTFTIILPLHVQQVELLGSWNNYIHHSMAANPGDDGTAIWYINLKFPSTGSTPIKRYFYYYLLDGYFASYDPNSPCIKIDNESVCVLNHMDIERFGTGLMSQDQLPNTPATHVTDPNDRINDNQPPLLMPQPSKTIVRAPVYSCYSDNSCYSDIATIASSRLSSFSICTWSSESKSSGDPGSPILDTDLEVSNCHTIFSGFNDRR